MKKLIITSLITISLIGAVFAAEDEYAKKIEGLIPTLASTNVPERYGAQMELQKLALSAGRPGAEAERAAMAKALAAKAVDSAVPQPARVWIVRQIEYIGGEECVDALQKVLKENDAELRECARRALEKNPSPAAIMVLRNQLKEEKDPVMKSGLIHSLGERADRESVQIISQYLKDEKLGMASALALGKIATPEAANALLTVLNENPFAAEAAIEAGNRLVSSGNKTAAKQIFLAVYAKCKLASARGAALFGLGKADADGSYNTIADAVVKGDEKLQILAVNAVKESYKDYSKRLMDLYPKTSQAAKIAILGVVDRSAEQQVIDASKEDNQAIRSVALRALGRIGSASSVPILLNYVVDGTAEEKTAAENALNSIAGKDVEKALENFAVKGESKLRVAAINAIGARKQNNSAPVIVKLISDSDPSVRKAAFSTIGKIGTDAEFDHLASVAIKEKSKDAITALEQVARRVKDREGAGKRLVSAIGNDENALVSLLGVLSAIGTDECLKPVSGLLQHKDNSVKLAAVQAMSEWQGLTAAKYLLAIVSDANTPKNISSIALRGISSIVSSAEGAAFEKAEIVLQAFKSVRDEADKKLVISAMAYVPDPSIAQALIPLLTDPQFKLEAGQAAINVAESLAKTDRKTALELANAIQKANISPELTKRASRIR